MQAAKAGISKFQIDIPISYHKNLEYKTELIITSINILFSHFPPKTSTLPYNFPLFFTTLPFSKSLTPKMSDIFISYTPCLISYLEMQILPL